MSPPAGRVPAGAALSREAIRLAQAAGARTIDLTSRPAREAANRLYQQLGFQLRDTHVYRLADGGAGPGRVDDGVAFRRLGPADADPPAEFLTGEDWP
jgi:ribosomal protein S18 acetylase RimI-like enzyme